MADFAFIEALESLVRDRLRQAPADSYTAKLARLGVLGVAQKVGEEGVELALAGAAQDKADVVGEAADLLFHMLVLLALRDIPFASVVDTLEARHRDKSAR